MSTSERWSKNHIGVNAREFQHHDVIRICLLMPKGAGVLCSVVFWCLFFDFFTI